MQGLTFFLLAAVVLFAIVIWMRARRPGSNGGDGSVMKDLRLRLLSEIPDGVGAETHPNEPLVAVMDIAFPTATATVFGATTGDASIYLSSGGVLGGIGHENVRAVAIAFVHESAKHLGRMAVTSEFPYPAPGHVGFYIRTRDAVFGAERPEQSLSEKQDPLWPLFFAGQNVISELRVVAPNFG